MNIYVGNLPFTATDEELRELFGEYGSVNRANIIIDRETGRSRGFGFVEMDDRGEAEAALRALAGAEMGGRNLTVNEARPRNDGPRR